MIPKISFIPFLLICMVGCSSTHIESNKDSTYQKFLNRVLIYPSPKNSVYDPQLVAKLLADKLDKRGVATQIIAQKNPDIQDMKSVLKNDSNDYKKSQILTLLTTEDNSLVVVGGLGPGTQPYQFERRIVGLDITVYDVDLQKNVWRAIAYGKSNSLADTIIDKLNVDGMLPMSVATHKAP